MNFRSKIKPKLEAVGDLVKATSFHDNGKVQQVGFIKMGNYKENGFLMIVMVIKQPWQHMIMVKKNWEVVFWNNANLSESRLFKYCYMVKKLEKMKFLWLLLNK
jgi:hypothetical protein